MSRYNFDKGNSEFGETIKLDGLNKKVREERSSGGRGGNGGGRKRRRKRKRNGGILVPAVLIGIIAAVVIFVLAFVLMGGGIKPAPELTDDQTTGKEGFYALISSKNSNGKVGFYDFEHDVIYNMAIDENTVVTDSSGSMIKQSTVQVGDMIKAYIDFDKKQVMSVNYTEDVWKRDNILGSAVSVSGDTITIGSTVYNYKDGMIVVFEDSIADINDISDGDVLCVQGYQNNVWSIRIKESGGYVSIIGWEDIENGTISVDGKAAVKIDSDKLKIEGGMHTVVIKGDNIDDYTTEVYITPGSEVGINLDSYLSKGEVVFKANVEDYDIYINGSLFEQNEKCELPYGVYTLSVVKDGYNTWFKEIELKEKTMELEIKLEKINERGRITIYSQPSAAEIYIDEEYVGRAPIMLEKAYGDYLVRASLEGYPDSIDVVTISGADMSYTAKLILEEE
ncbi:MAG: PEGA domain-containing protein [Lachnospiraceae bacterium]|nr:PEGA domain-containing protein [Lachnospiraceae bacterium]